MISPIFITDYAITLSETAFIATAFALSFVLLRLCALQYAVGRSLRAVPLKNASSGLRTGPITGLTTNEKNTYQCAPERGSTCGHGQWSATIRSGCRSSVSRAEKIQRLQG